MRDHSCCLNIGCYLHVKEHKEDVLLKEVEAQKKKDSEDKSGSIMVEKDAFKKEHVVLAYGISIIKMIRFKFSIKFSLQ